MVTFFVQLFVLMLKIVGKLWQVFGNEILKQKDYLIAWSYINGNG